MVRDMASRLDSLLAGDAIVPTAPKFQFKVLAHIDAQDSGHFCLRIQSPKVYARANLEGQKLLQKYTKDSPLLYKSLAPTVNNAKCMEGNDTVQIKDSSIAIAKPEDIGEGSIITKSVIGRGVVIGSKVKISNSVILSNCKIGDECIIQKSIILTKCGVADKSQLNDEEVEHESLV